MKGNYLQLWFEARGKRVNSLLSSRLTAAGECKKHLGPTFQFARVSVSVEPADEFDVVDLVPQNEELKRLRYPDYVIFGLLDVLITSDYFPLSKVRIILTNVEYNAVESSAMAFREAGRDFSKKNPRRISEI